MEPSGYTSPGEFHIEGDATAASYHFALAAVTAGRVTVENIGSSSIQAEALGFPQLLARMGCLVEQSERSTTVEGCPLLCAISSPIDMALITDCFMTLAVVL